MSRIVILWLAEAKIVGMETRLFETTQCYLSTFPFYTCLLLREWNLTIKLFRNSNYRSLVQ